MLAAMLTSGRASDIVLHCGHRELAAHHLALRTRSAFFEGLFSSTMRDAAGQGKKRAADEAGLGFIAGGTEDVESEEMRGREAARP